MPGSGGADGRGRELQILVAGEGLTAAVTAGFLDQAGLDPVVARPSATRLQPGAVVLWEPALSLLERLGLRRPLERAGHAVWGLDCRTAGLSWAVDGDRAPLLAVDGERLEARLDRQLLGRVRTPDRSVEVVEPTGSGVRATFEGGVAEPFDAVVATTRSVLPEPATGDAWLHSWEGEWPESVPAPEQPTEAWHRDRAAFTVPVGEGCWLRLVAATDTPPDDALSVEHLAERFGPLFADASDPFDALVHHTLRYGRHGRVVPRSLREGGVALAGPAARATVPGDALGPSLGVEDAWVLADALAYGPARTGDALDAYEHRRRRRARTVATLAEATTSERAGELTPALARLCARRTLAYSHVVADHLPEPARTVPRCL